MNLKAAPTSRPGPTSRLVFRTWEESDFELAMGLWGNAQVTKFIGGPVDERQVRERLKTECERQARYGLQYWPMFLVENGDFVGCCGLRPHDLQRGVLELGFHSRPKYWGQGMSTESGRAVIAHAFEKLCAEGLFAGHHPQNQISKRVLEKLGFRYTHDELYRPTGLQHPSYLLTADEHRRQQLGTSESRTIA